MRLAWLTDVHLNFIDANLREMFYQEIINTECDGVLISGDIAEAPSLKHILSEMAAFLGKPIYFILGNHDYYRGQVQEVRESMIALTESSKMLFWLPAIKLKQLSENTVLVGQDGWADGRLGDYTNSRVVLNDSRMITDLFLAKLNSKHELLHKMQELADTDAMQLKHDLIQAADLNPKKIIVLTHVPPFKKSCMHEGEISGEEWLPFFSSKAMGDVLTYAAQKYTKIEFLVLCGHTHSQAEYKPFQNMTINVGKSEYSRPEIQCLIGVTEVQIDS